MDANERQLIDTLFGKLRQVDGQAPARDAEAEALIRDHLAQVPAAPYYMAQAILTQEQALTAAQQRIQELERQRSSQPTGGSFLSGLFGGGPRPAAPPPQPAYQTPPYQPPPGPAMSPGPWGARPFGGGGGFLAGAAQTAVGVAGGMLAAEAIGSLFSGHAAQAATPLIVEEKTPQVIDQQPVAFDQPAPQDTSAGDNGGFQDASFDDNSGDADFSGDGDFGSQDV